MISRCARGMSTAPSWSTSRPAGRWTCSPSGPRNPSASGWTPTRAWRSSAATAAAATPKAPPRARRWPSRSPTGGICGTTWPKPSSVPSPATVPACKNRHPTLNPLPAEQSRAAAGAGLAARTRARHAEVHAALARGLTITEISRTLRLDRKTVPPLRHRRDRRRADRRRPPDPARPARPAPGLPAPAMGRRHPQHRTAARGTARPRLPRQPAHPAPAHRPAAPATPPSPHHHQHRRPGRWPAGSSPRPATSTDDDRAALAQITARCEELTTTRDLVREFADMLCHRHGERLEAWASQAEASPVSELRGFAKGLRKDWAAVTAGLTALQLRRRRRPRQPHQDDQKTDVRPGETRPAPQARPARRLTRSRQLSQSHFLVAVVNPCDVQPKDS